MQEPIGEVQAGQLLQQHSPAVLALPCQEKLQVNQRFPLLNDGLANVLALDAQQVLLAGVRKRNAHGHRLPLLGRLREGARR